MHSIWLENICHSTATRETPKRRMKETLFTRYRNTVEPIILADNRKATLCEGGIKSGLYDHMTMGMERNRDMVK